MARNPAFVVTAVLTRPGTSRVWHDGNPGGRPPLTALANGSIFRATVRWHGFDDGDDVDLSGVSSARRICFRAAGVHL